jgi:pyrroline-5-carboxylate reductase
MTIHGTLGFLGYGNMGGAILDGLIRKGAIDAGNARVFEVDENRREHAAAQGIAVADTPDALAAQCDSLVIAVKPQVFDEAVAPLRAVLAERNPLLVSIMAGISIGYIQCATDSNARVARVMPNLPALVSASAAGIAFSDSCTDADRATARAVFEAVGVVEFVEESAIDAITALSGSGPAYFFYMVECMAKAGEALGLDADQATRLAAQTALGAGLMLQSTGAAPSELRAQVTSKGGTTFAALESFRGSNLEGVVEQAMRAAANRSRELGK